MLIAVYIIIMINNKNFFFIPKSKIVAWTLKSHTVADFPANVGTDSLDTFR
jgi:hypothetical protein